MRRAVIDRRTTETQIELRLGLDGRGTYQVRTGIRFLDHMLELVARHGAFDLEVRATKRRRDSLYRSGLGLGRVMSLCLQRLKTSLPERMLEHW